MRRRILSRRNVNPRGGETLVEIIIAFLLFSILLLGATTMVQVALRITVASRESANAAQDAANELILSGYAFVGAPQQDLVIAFRGSTWNQRVWVPADEGLFAFTPVEIGGGP